MQIFPRRVACAACALVAGATPAAAHVIAGARVFPVTLTFDDPGVSDEASFPSFQYTRTGANGGTGPTHEVDLGFEYDKTITDNTALIINDGYDVVHTENSGTEAGWENLVITGKWQAWTNAPHEAVVSLGVIREIGGTGTDHVNGNRFGSTTPTVYGGKGFGDVPADWVRPFAVSGELGYTIADTELKRTAPANPAQGIAASFTAASFNAASFNDGNSNAWFGAFSVQYSIPYLQSQVRNVGIGGIFAKMIPIVEFTWSSPASQPSNGATSWIAAPGVIYLAQWGELGVEALVPLDHAAGTNVGAVGLVHFFFDDLFPHSIGKPLLQ